MDLKTAWCVKHTLTKGVFPLAGEFIGTTGRYFSKKKEGGQIGFFLLRKEVCATLEEASEVAESLRAAKIASLEKQIKTLRSTQIKVWPQSKN